MAKLKNLIGQKFGMLTVIDRADNDGKRVCWTCICDCGNPIPRVVRAQNLLNGNTTSCGCTQRQRGREDLIGQKFGMLTVLAQANDKIRSDGTHIVMWHCMCDCGNEIIVNSGTLKSGHTKSCGCLQGEHHNDSNHKTGKTRLYRIWGDMKQRCYNKNNLNFKNYGGRGIVICDEWKNSYIKFKEWAIKNGYNDDLTIEITDVNGNYCPENCKWATQLEQANNTRTNRMITFNGETLTWTQWNKKLGFKRGVLEYRLKKGWSIEKALTTPLLKNH